MFAPVPGWFDIASPAPDATIDRFPVTFEIDYGGSIVADSWAARLKGPGAAEQPFISAFSARDGLATAVLPHLAEGNYTLTISATDAGGKSLEEAVSFTVPSVMDLVIPPKGVTIAPHPLVGQPVQVGAVIINQGNLPTPPTTVEVGETPDDPADPPVALPPVDVPQLEPGASFLMEAVFTEVNGPGNVSVIVDPGNGVTESDENNNFGGGRVVPGTKTFWTDLAVAIKDFTIVANDTISLRIVVGNEGTTTVDLPQMRYFVWDDASGTPLAVMGGGAGRCIATNPNATVGVLALAPLAPGEVTTNEYTLNFSAPGVTPSGAYRMCVEVIASDPSNPDPVHQWGPALTETDEHNTPMVANNEARTSWDVRNLGPYPATGDVDLFTMVLDDNRTGATSRLDITLVNGSFPDIGHAAVKLRAGAIGGYDDGQVHEDSAFTPLIIGGERPLLRLPIPGNFLGGPIRQLPRSPFVDVTMTVRAGQDGSGAVLIEETRRLALEYHDAGIAWLGVTPPEPLGHPPNTTGEPPLKVSVHVRNEGSEPVTLDLTMEDQNAGVDTGPLSGSPKTLSLASLATEIVTFDWNPTQLTTHTLVANIVNPLPPDSGNAETFPDNRSLLYDVTLPPDIHGVAAEPDALEINPGNPVPLRVKMYDRNTSRESFTLRVYDSLAGSSPVISKTVGPLGATPEWVDLTNDWVPPRAGYHDLSFRVLNPISQRYEERFSHRVDISPQLVVTGEGPVLPASEVEYNITGGFGTNPVKLFTRADSIIVGGDGSGVTGAKYISFRVDDGTSNTNHMYLVRIKANSKYVGVAQSTSLTLADTLWRLGIGMGVKKSGFCWVRDACPDDFLVHKTLWYDDTGGLGIGELMAAAGETIISQAAEHLGELQWGAKGSTAVGAIGVALDLAFFAHDAAVCDAGPQGEGDSYLTVPLRNQEDYDLYIVLESRVASAAIFGDAWSYVDFWDYVSPNCGGTREGINIDLIGHELYPLPR